MRHSSAGKIGVMAACAMFVIASAAIAGDHQFVGASKCSTCHKTAAQGEQFPKWQASQHSKAFATLASDEAKEIGKKLSIDDPQKSDTCLRCHVTGHGAAAEMLGPKYDATEGVGCESCHGAGGDYIKKATMEGLMTGAIEAASVGMVTPDDKLCVTCHNDKSPTFKGFDYDKYVEKIAHPIPADRKAKYSAPAGGSK
ncbi:MAG: multiheme c-type cytochrome [Candidatus Krumholzibacteria bacterium]|nr:multiheme c-type cytochrome [Candidatus Krumholzibacteria bacterium]MDH4337332.1 multiheme c-type cytochrome [Candidatus Krumholzibacteria bacterium]MDH5269955.1 multiheme c-type cytochrome [Candidatus Krumholzibacteria bacterium]